MTIEKNPLLFKAELIFKDVSRKPAIFKNFSRASEPCVRFFYRSANFNKIFGRKMSKSLNILLENGHHCEKT